MKFIQLSFKTPFFQDDKYHIFVIYFQRKEKIYGADNSEKIKGESKNHTQHIEYNPIDAKMLKIKHFRKKDVYVSFIPFNALNVAFQPTDIWSIEIYMPKVNKDDKDEKLRLYTTEFIGHNLIDQEEDELYRNYSNEHFVKNSGNDLGIKQHLENTGKNVEYANRILRVRDATETRDQLHNMQHAIIENPIDDCFKHLNSKESLSYKNNSALTKESLSWKSEAKHMVQITGMSMVDVNITEPCLRICFGSNIIPGGSWTQGYEGDEEDIFIRSSACITMNITNPKFKEEFYPLDESGSNGVVYVPRVWVFRERYVSGIGFKKNPNIAKYQSYLFAAKVRNKKLEDHKEIDTPNFIYKQATLEMISKLHDVLQTALFYGYRKVILNVMFDIDIVNLNIDSISAYATQVANLYKTILHKQIFSYRNKFLNIIIATENPIIYNAFNSVFNETE